MNRRAKLAGRRQPPVELSEQGEEFWTAVRNLPHRQAQAAALRFVYDMPLAEIATTLGTSEGTVKQHLSRARLPVAMGILSRAVGVEFVVDVLDHGHFEPAGAK